MVHTVAAVWFLRVWLWHLTPAAAPLPGRQGFGWFVRFLTFYSYTIQTVTLVIASVDDWSKLVRARPSVGRGLGCGRSCGGGAPPASAACDRA